MSFNRVCNCACADCPDGFGDCPDCPECGALCNPECPESFGVNISVPSTSTCQPAGFTGAAEENCCSFTTAGWTNTLVMKNRSAYCGGTHCHWRSVAHTPHCTSNSHCAFPYNSISPDLSCYGASIISKGIEAPTTSQLNTVVSCGPPPYTLWDNLGHDPCVCVNGNGPCRSDGISVITSNEEYEAWRQIYPIGSGLMLCGMCQCQTGTNAPCPSDCDSCSYCTGYGGYGSSYCSPNGNARWIETSVGMYTTAWAALIFNGSINRFEITVRVGAANVWAAQIGFCDGTWGTMIAESDCFNYCCQAGEPDSGCPHPQSYWREKCGFGESPCSANYVGVGESQTWLLPEGITPANCTEVSGLSQDSSGVEMKSGYDYERMNLTSYQQCCLDVEVGRPNYFNVAKEFDVDWTIG